MTRPRSVGETLARALKQVVGGNLRRSFNGQEIWRDDHTWRELAGSVARALKGSVVLVEIEEYKRLVADANQFQVIRNYVKEYQARLPKDKQQNVIRNPYARWAAENMTEAEKKEGT